jgi:hypothetical protein
MLPLEVVDPGGSLSMLPSPHRNGERPVREGFGQVAMVMAAYSCNWGASFSAAESRQWQCGGSGHHMALDSKFCDFFCIRIFASWPFIKYSVFVFKSIISYIRPNLKI